MSEKKDPKDTCVLVTGGAGFIGSHTCVELLQDGYQVVIVDDLSNASEKVLDRIDTIVGDEAAKNLTFYEANVLDRDAMNKIFDTHQIDLVATLEQLNDGVRADKAGATGNEDAGVFGVECFGHVVSYRIRNTSSGEYSAGSCSKNVRGRKSRGLC